MPKYQAPNGYRPHESAGYHYKEEFMTAPNGQQVRHIYYFNDETGEYTQQTYPLDESVTQTVQSAPKKKKAAPIAILACVAVIVAAGIFVAPRLEKFLPVSGDDTPAVDTMELNEAITAIDAKIAELTDDGIFSDEEIEQVFAYMQSLEAKGAISELTASNGAMLFTAADGMCGAILIEPSSGDYEPVQIESTSLSPTANTNPHPKASNTLLAISLAATPPKTAVAPDGEIYLANKSVLFISTQSKRESNNASALSKLRDKGYTVTELYSASYEELAALGGGGYGLIIIDGRGAIYADKSYLCLPLDFIPAQGENPIPKGYLSEVCEIDRKAYIIGYVYVVDENGNTLRDKFRKVMMGSEFFTYFAPNVELTNTHVNLNFSASMLSYDFSNAFTFAGAQSVSGYTDYVQDNYRRAVQQTLAEKISEVELQATPQISIKELHTEVQGINGTNTYRILEKYMNHPNSMQNREVHSQFNVAGGFAQKWGVRPEPPELVETPPTEIITGQYIVTDPSNPYGTMGGGLCTFSIQDDKLHMKLFQGVPVLMQNLTSSSFTTIEGARSKVTREYTYEIISEKEIMLTLISQIEEYPDQDKKPLIFNINPEKSTYLLIEVEYFKQEHYKKNFS